MGMGDLPFQMVNEATVFHRERENTRCQGTCVQQWARSEAKTMRLPSRLLVTSSFSSLFPFCNVRCTELGRLFSRFPVEWDLTTYFCYFFTFCHGETSGGDDFRALLVGCDNEFRVYLENRKWKGGWGRWHFGGGKFPDKSRGGASFFVEKWRRKVEETILSKFWAKSFFQVFSGSIAAIFNLLALRVDCLLKRRNGEFKQNGAMANWKEMVRWRF